jgi:hypothetical protein
MLIQNLLCLLDKLKSFTCIYCFNIFVCILHFIIYLKTATNLPPDEYERPDEMVELRLNRLDATSARQQQQEHEQQEAGVDNTNSDSISISDSLSLPFSERLHKSLFGQIHARIGDWDARNLRKSFVHIGDAGQRRAFYVKFLGEGVDDHGGPYRAAFETAIGDEPQHLLKLLVPCANSRENIGSNRDQTVLNPAFLHDSSKLPLYRHLGRLVGVACRHRILSSLSLPRLLWSPVAGEAIGNAEISATDLHITQALQSITTTSNTSNSSSSNGSREEEEVRGEEVADMLTQLLRAPPCSMSPAQARLLVMGGIKRGIKTAPTRSDDANNENENDENDDDDEKDSGDESGDVVVVSMARRCRLAALIQQRLLISQRPGLQQMCNGLAQVLPSELCALFTPQELEVLVCGEPEVDISLLQKVTEYDGVSASDR